MFIKTLNCDYYGSEGEQERDYDFYQNLHENIFNKNKN
jgi:hypothetical protein